MRVLAACSLGGAGHLGPLVPFLDAALDAGDETLVVGPPSMHDMVGATGHPFVAGDEPPESAVAPIREQLPVAPPAEAAVLGNRELFGRLATDAMLPGMQRVVTDRPPDLVLRDPCEYASALVARSAGLPIAQVGIGLSAVEWPSIDLAGEALVAHDAGIVAALRTMPYLTRFPESVDPSPFPDTRRYRVEHKAMPRPLPDWWRGSSAPLVYVSFGTVLGHMTRAAAAYRTVLRAVADLDARVLLTIGRQLDVSVLGAVPSHVHVEAWVDQADVLPHAEVVVSHGGSGTSFGALAAGVPLVLVPLFADQRANARQVAAAGAGIAIDDVVLGDETTLVTASGRIADAIETVRTERSHAVRARDVATEMAAAPTAAERLAELLAAR